MTATNNDWIAPLQAVHTAPGPVPNGFEATSINVPDEVLDDLRLRLGHTRWPDELPDDLELHDWARSALGDNAGGGRLGLLAWAFDRRGDQDMSALLLGEVESHLPVPLARLAPMVPRLHAWLAPRIAALPTEDD